MKRLILILVLSFIATPLIAGTWCMWSGTEGTYCQSDSRGYVRMPDGHLIGASEENFNYHGFYERITTQPTLGADQVRDTEVWGFADNEISLTWTVKDLTAQEILERDAGAMSLTDYLQWNALVAGGVFTSEQIVTYLTANYPEIVDAYLARKTLLEQ